MNRSNLFAAARLWVLVALVPGLAVAEPVATEVTGQQAWQFATLLYLSITPILTVKATFPTGASSDISVDANDLIQ